MQGRAERTAVIIPALNEEESLPHVLADLPAGWVDLVVVVDNGSTDGTPRAAAAHGSVVVHEPRRGYGAAMLRGLEEVRRLQPETEIIVFLDADYSDHPESLPCLVRPILDNEADFVLGSRLKGDLEPGAMPLQSRWGNLLACGLMRLFWGVSYSDLGPFRAIRFGALEQLGMEDGNYGWTVEMQIKAARAGLRIMEVPVPYRQRIGTSKISGTLRGCLCAGWKILYTIARHGLFGRRTLGRWAARRGFVQSA